jgi:hypothetical protein
MMRKQLLAVAVSGVAALALVSPGADAASHQRSTASHVVSKKLDASKAEHDRIVAYWTPKRMREAIPGDVLVANRDKSSATGTVAMGKPTVIQPQARPGGGGSAGGGFTGGYYPESPVTPVHKTTGKVFFTLGGTRYVCSGSSTTSANGSVVTTAGHCLNEGPGAFATEFMFAPGYNDGATPYGQFTATELLTTTQWATAGNFNYDVGFAVVGTSGGKTLAQAVGTQGIAFNTGSPAYGQTMHSFGYPAANPYDGSDLAWCWGTTVRDTFGGSTDYGLNCNLTGGSSGGPWFFGFNTGAGTGTQGSVNSFKYSGGKFKSYMWGPVFGSAVQSVYNQAQS